MKKTTLFVLMLVASSSSLFAQDMPLGKYVIGGNLGFYTDRNESTNSTNNKTINKSTNFHINPYVGKILSEKWMFGTSLNYNLTVSKFNNTLIGSENKITRNSFQGGVFVRYSYNPKNKLVLQLMPFANVGFIVSKNKNNTTDDKNENLFVGLGATPMVSYSVSPKVNLIGRFGQATFVSEFVKTDDYDGIDNKNSFNLSFSLSSIGIGIELIL